MILTAAQAAQQARAEAESRRAHAGDVQVWLTEKDVKALKRIREFVDLHDFPPDRQCADWVKRGDDVFAIRRIYSAAVVAQHNAKVNDAVS